MGNAVFELLAKVETLSKQVQGLSNRLGNLEEAASATSGSEHGAVGTSRKGKNKQPKDNPKKAKGKQAFVDIEKERQYRLLTEQMRLRGRGNESTTALDTDEVGGDDEGSDSSSSSESADTVASAVSKASGESKTSKSSRRQRRKKKVKSGAKMKQRPVLKAELWPHTVANKEEGGEFTAENIRLSKFMLYFTHTTNKYIRQS